MNNKRQATCFNKILKINMLGKRFMNLQKYSKTFGGSSVVEYLPKKNQ